MLAATIVPLLGAEMRRRNSQLAGAGHSTQKPSVSVIEMLQQLSGLACISGGEGVN